MTAMVFHAEKLHHERVFARLEKVCSWMARHGMRATLFVYPFRAQVARRNIEEQVQGLAALGHEIGQHTHFYHEDNIDNLEKINDFSAMNVERCLHRDCETLGRMGYTPKGFTAGSWVVNETVWDILIKFGFSYDCSALFPKPGGTANLIDVKWLESPKYYINEGGQILCLPTTCSLGEWFKWGYRTKTNGQVPYRIVYVHDYDVLSAKSYLLLCLFLGIHRSKQIVPVSVLSKLFGYNGTSHDTCP